MSELRRIGLIGGISWTSTEVYHRLINQRVHARLGGNANAPMILWSVDFAEVEALQRAGDWAALGKMFSDAAQRLETAGARAIGICANTMHLVADDVANSVDVPLLHLIELTAQECVCAGYATVGLIGTEYTMSSDMFASRLAPRGVTALVPQEPDRAALHHIIYAELTRAVVNPDSAAVLLEVIERLVARGAQAVILGCTEFELLVADGDASVPLLDTTQLHAEALADFVLDGTTRGISS